MEAEINMEAADANQSHISFFYLHSCLLSSCVGLDYLYKT